MNKTIILTGGGSAGHVTPNLALIPRLKKDGFQVKYIGTKDGIEREIIDRERIPYYPISAGKLRRYFSFKNFTDPFRIARGYFQAKKILKKEKPDVVFSKGGFVTVPVVFAAKKRGIPVVLHESDYTPGLANRLAIPKATKVCVSFEAASKEIPASKCVLTGAPVRAELFSGDKQQGLSILGFAEKKPILLIMGGSLGAASVNDAVDHILPKLLEEMNVVHIRGEGKLNPELEGLEGYRQFAYITDQLPHIFAATDFMLSRAGANAIFEILALHIPALLVPLPLEASRGDQILNARFFEGKGFSLVLQQSDITDQSLYEAIQSLQEKAPVLKENMRNSGISNGTDNVISVIYSVLEK